MDNKAFDFKNPPAEYGEVSFFWWHGDDITKEKLLWILEQLKDKHICGLQINYCHGNKGGRMYGLTMESNPKPFSDAWWELVKWFVGECKKYGISVSLSDYTLGSPGQEYYVDWVLQKHPEMLGQRLRRDENGNVEVETVPFSMNPMARGIGNAVVDEFYGAFERHLPDECGSGINYFFSDELNFNIAGNLWCDDFKEEFIKRKGYDVTDKWKAIFEDIGDETEKIRLDYYDVIVQLSEERYFKPVYDWHEERGMTFGCDHGGRGQRITEFGDYFRTMKWNQGPGNDQPHLSSNIIKSKCSASIAHMYNRPRVWLEGFYSSGWDTGSDSVADATFRNFALGHNLLSLHGLYYSTHGSMWEWAPPCNHHHMPYWTLMDSFLECTKRLSYLNSVGVHRADVAIVYPVAAAEADAAQGKEAAATAFETANYIYPLGIDFDFIDFESIERATVRDGKLCVSGEEFSTVIIPDMKAVRFAMMPRLLEFARSGGQVIFQKCLPESSDRAGRNDAVLNSVVNEILSLGHKVDTPAEIVDKIKMHRAPDFECDSVNPFVHHRIIDGKNYYLVYNVPNGTTLRFRSVGYPTLLDAWTGNATRLENYSICGDITEIDMPLTEKELLVICFEPVKEQWEQLPKFSPLSKSDTVVKMDGEWDCELIPTMNNRYGDWRLPAFDGFIGAEARRLEYGSSSSTYSYGTYFHFCEGALDEKALINATSPTPEMKEYRYSKKYGVEGDAGAQGSYHGLKCCLSDEFLVMGTKRITYVGSSSVYEGEGPYYFFTSIYLDKDSTVVAEAGDYLPEKIWIDHSEAELGELRLSAGRHYILLKFPHGGRSYFVIKKSDRFVQNTPLVTKWYKNTDIIDFDAFPERTGKICKYEFTAPPGAFEMKIDADIPVKAYIDGKELSKIAENEFSLQVARATRITIHAEQRYGCYDTAIFNAPIIFKTRNGIYDLNRSFDEQGLDFYSGGIRLKKSVDICADDGRVFFEADDSIGCAMEVKVNGSRAAVMLTQPYRADITDLAHSGTNEIEVIAYNTPHNHMKTIPSNYNAPRARAKRPVMKM